MPVQAIASAAADEPARAGWTRKHPLAAVAAGNCKKHVVPRAQLVGRVACADCWTDAEVADFRFALDEGLPLELVPDPSYVDEVAVERAVHQAVYTDHGSDAALAALTRAERFEAKRRLVSHGRRFRKFTCSRTRREASR